MPDSAGFSTLDTTTAFIDLTEDGVALAFVGAHAGDLRYCHHSQHWFVWTGSHWRREEAG